MAEGRQARRERASGKPLITQYQVVGFKTLSRGGQEVEFLEEAKNVVLFERTTSHSLHTATRARASGLTCVVWWAHTHIGVDPVHTGGVVLTVAVLAVVWVDLTPLPLEAQGAGAALGMCGCEEGSRGSGRGVGCSGRGEGGK